MEISNYHNRYQEAISGLWNSSGTRQGFVPMSGPELSRGLMEHPYFSDRHAFVLTHAEPEGSPGQEAVWGFICGCTGDELPGGNERGFFTCLLLAEEAETQANALRLLKRLEESFRAAGKVRAVCSFFNPMRLPWRIPGRAPDQHNNAPGIALDIPLYQWMRQAGYQETATECAMYLNLAEFHRPEGMAALCGKAGEAGYQVEWYRHDIHSGLETMVESLGNPQWNVEIPVAAREINMLVAVKERQVVGFAGPVYPEATGRGYFAGIGVAKAHEHKGLGRLLFYSLCEAEKKAGARYMSLFTGSDNHAGKIYQDAGFVRVRLFAVMAKDLC